LETELFDAQCGFGGAKPGVRERVTAEDWSAEMRRLGIARALVRIQPEDTDIDVEHSNATLFAACRGNADFVPCPVVVPAGAGDLPSEEEQAASLIASGAGAAWIRPARDCWTLDEWASGKLFRALESRRVPVLCPEPAVPLSALADLARRYPKLPLVTIDGGYRSSRMLVPLLSSFPNVLLSIGSNYTVHRGIEQLVATAGAERLVFGTGYPHAEPMPAITQLMYAEIGDEQRTLIGSGNLERLISGVVR
jgi:predicted TIM-barrel fold metal-dependent hydrolase